MQINRRSFLLAVATLPWVKSLQASECNSENQPLQIGLSLSLLDSHIKSAMGQKLVQPMADLFVIPGKPKAYIQLDTAENLAKKVSEKSIHLAVMAGIEYGWWSLKYPNMQPMATAFNSDIRLKACLLVSKDLRVKNLSELQGKKIAIPARSQFHTQVYLDHKIRMLQHKPECYFSKVQVTGDVNEALDLAIERKVDAALIDGDSWKGYQERQPGRCRKFIMIDESKAFPTAALLYIPQFWKPEDSQLLSDVLLSAHERAFSRQILNFWRISKFVSYSDEYENVVKDIVEVIQTPVKPQFLSK